MADSDIVLGIDFDISNVKKTAQDIQKELNNGLKSGGGESPALKSIESQIDSLSQKVSDLTDAMKNITVGSGVGASTEAVEGLDATVQSLVDTLINLSETPPVNPIDVEGTEDSADIIEDVVEDTSENVAQTSANLVGFIAGLVSGFVSGLVTSAIRLISRLLGKLVNKLKQDVEDIVQFVTSGLQTIITLVGKLSKAIVKSFIGTTLKSMQFTFDLLKALIAKINSLKSVIVENLKIMAKWRNGNNALNKSLSNITSSLAYLKASLATVVAPIINYIEPVLTQLIDRLAEIITLIGMLIAKLTGASTFQKAIRKQKDFAKALKGSRDELASFDELNVLGEKNGEGVDFSEIGLEDADFPEWLKNIEVLKKKIFELGQLIGTKLRDWLNQIPWDKIKKGAEDTAEAISAFFDGLFSISGLGVSVGKSIGELLNTLTTFLDTLFVDMPWANIGAQLGQALQAMFESISWDNLGKLFADGFNVLFEMLYNFFISFDGKTLGEGLSTLFQNAIRSIDWTLIRGTLVEAVHRLIETLRELITPENFALLGTTLAEVINTVFTTLGTVASDMQKKSAHDKSGWTQFGESIATGIVEAIKGIDAKSAAEAVTALADGLLDMLLAAVTYLYEHIDEVTDKLIEFLSNINWEELGEKANEISDKLMDAFEQIWQALKDSGTLDRIIDFIVDVLNDKEAWEKAFKRVKRELFWEYIYEKGLKWSEGNREAVREWWNEIGKDIVDGILTGILGASPEDIGTAVQSFFDALWAALCGVFLIHSPSEAMQPIGENIVLGILDGFGLVDFLTEVQTWWDENVAPWFTSIKENIDLLTADIGLKMTTFKDSMIDTFRAIKNGIKIPINYIIAFVEGMVNKIISGLNWLIDGLSKVKFDVPDNPVLFGALSGTSFAVNLSKLEPITIPRLATGGVIPPSISEHLAMLGDNNHETEVVSPLSTMKEALIEALAESGMSGQPINIYLGTDLIYSEIRKMEKRHNVMMGG